VSTKIANTDMAKAWDGPEGASWSASVENYERATRRIWARFLSAVPVSADDRVLDVGCGNGKSTCDLAGAAATAVGIDLSAAMLGNGRQRAVSLGLANVTFVQGDAQVHPFAPGSCSLATSLFGSMFFADPVAAFANIGSALVPGGRLALLVWRELARNEWVTVFRTSLAAGRELPTPPPDAPGPFGLAAASRAESLLAAAGFAEVSFESIDEPADMGASADDAFAFMSSLGITRGLLEDLDEAARADGLDRLRAAISDHETPEGVLFPASAWLITARWPAV
jgi:SAM-dependent methyltransferase